jgi:WD40 repeat protein
LVQLDFCIYDIFDLPVLNEYELYIRSYGSSTSVQNTTQTNHDFTTTDVQTEDWYCADKWTQNPPHALIESGGESCMLPWMEKRKEKKNSSKKDKEAKFETSSLVVFLDKSVALIETILQEQSSLEFEDFGGSGDLMIMNEKIQTTPGFLLGFNVLMTMNIPGIAKNVLLCWTTDKPEGITDGAKTVILVWNMKESKVFRFMCCLPRTTTITVSEDTPYLIFAGTIDGSIQLWDLREAETVHKKTQLEIEVNQRWPSFITDNIYASNYGHYSPILNIIQKSISNSTGNISRSNQSFQIHSTDETGVVQSWVDNFLK